MKLTRAQLNLRPPKFATVPLAADLMTAHHGGASPWGNADRSSDISFQNATDHNRCATIWQAYQAYHMDSKKWNDIAYNFGVCPHAVIFEGRGPGVKSGAQLGDINNQTFAWCYIGGSGDPFPLSAQLAVHNETISEYGLRTTRDHSTWAYTECAGDAIRAAIKNWMAEGDPPTDNQKKELVMFIAKSTDTLDRERYAISDGVHRTEFISNSALSEAINVMKLPVVELTWEFWSKQLIDSKQNDLSKLPKAATAEEVIAATQHAIDAIKESLQGIVVDGKPPATGQDARKLILSLLGV